MRLTPKSNPKGDGFSIRFHHPIEKKTVARGLDTTDQTAADAICRDIESLFSNDVLLQDPRAELLAAYERRAVEIVFGEEKAAVLLTGQTGGLTSEDVAEVEVARRRANSIEQAIDATPQRRREIGSMEFAGSMRELNPRGTRLLKEDLERVQKALKHVTQDRDYLKTESIRMNRKHNVHVKTSVGEAKELWLSEYATGRAERTYSDAKTWVEAFIKSLDGADKFKLAELKAGHVDSWLASMKKDDGTDLAAPTRQQRKAWVSTFVNWAYRRFDLSENPMDKTAPVAGKSRVAEDIRAIRKLADIKKFIRDLAPEAYWQAWVAFAMFCGPRYSEQVTTRLSQVYLKDDYVVLKASKTGRERRVPIERSFFRTYLDAHVKRRLAEQKAEGATPAQQSDWLFPTLLDEGRIARTKSAPCKRRSKTGAEGGGPIGGPKT